MQLNVQSPDLLSTMKRGQKNQSAESFVKDRQLCDYVKKKANRMNGVLLNFSEFIQLNGIPSGWT